MMTISTYPFQKISDLNGNLVENLVFPKLLLFFFLFTSGTGLRPHVIFKAICMRGFLYGMS